jgi:hypothetical protein
MLSPRALLASTGLALLTSVTGCGTSFVPAKEADTVLIEGNPDPMAVRAAVVRAMDVRRFSPITEGDGNIHARFRKGDATVEVSIEYTAQQYVVKYLTSSGLETQKGPRGELLVDSRYDRWAHALSKAIATELKRPGKERALAERRQRDQELRVEQQRTQQAQAQAAQADADARASQGFVPPTVPEVLGALPAVLPSGGQPVQVEHTTSVRHSEQSLTCCINGAKYNCPGQDAFNACMSMGPSQCTPAGRCN